MYVPHRHAFLYEPKEDDEEELEKGKMESRNGMIVGKHTHKLSIISYIYAYYYMIKSKNVCVIYDKMFVRINVRGSYV